MKKFTKDDWKKISERTDANTRAVAALMTAGKVPKSKKVRAEAAKHHADIERFYDGSKRICRGLGDMYLAGHRFGDFYRKYHADLPEFLVKAVHAFCDIREKKA